MTLAIGDDVGIDISGQEGRQVAMASDFAMGQLRFLVPPLGSWSLELPKNGLYDLVQLLQKHRICFNSFLNGVVCCTLVVYTALPTIIVGKLDKYLSRKILLKYPQLYGSGQREERYSLKLFVLTMLDTVWQSATIFIIPYLAYKHTEIDSSSNGDLWTIAVI